MACARFASIALLTLTAGVWVVAEQSPTFKSGVDFVELDAVVDDGNGQPVKGLRKDEFVVRDGGQPVVIETFAELDADGAATVADARFIVLVLDDWIEPLYTTNVRRIAGLFVQRMGPLDTLCVIRLNGDAVTSPMSRGEAMTAVGRFQATGPGLLPAADRARHSFETIGELSRQMAPIPHRRKTLVFVGAPGYVEPAVNEKGSRINRPIEFMSGEHRDLWFGADAAASRANVAVYVFDPATTTLQRQFFDRKSVGFATETSGMIFNGLQVFGKAVDQVWSESGHYYVLGYAKPTSSKSSKHRIEVKVSRSGASVHARRERAE